MGRRLVRGTPIYVANQGERIAIVPEVAISRKAQKRKRMRYRVVQLEPEAVYLVDKAGVRRVAVGMPGPRRARLVVMAFLAAPVLSMLVRWRSRNG